LHLHTIKYVSVQKKKELWSKNTHSICGEKITYNTHVKELLLLIFTITHCFLDTLLLNNMPCDNCEGYVTVNICV